MAVLGDLAVQDGLATWNEDLHLEGSNIEHEFEFPECLLSWAFEDINLNTKYLATSTPFIYLKVGTSLAERNDEGASFAELSQLVEEHF